MKCICTTFKEFILRNEFTCHLKVMIDGVTQRGISSFCTISQSKRNEETRINVMAPATGPIWVSSWAFKMGEGFSVLSPSMDYFSGHWHALYWHCFFPPMRTLFDVLSWTSAFSRGWMYCCGTLVLACSECARSISEKICIYVWAVVLQFAQGYSMSFEWSSMYIWHHDMSFVSFHSFVYWLHTIIKIVYLICVE